MPWRKGEKLLGASGQGALQQTLLAGPTARFDYANSVEVKLHVGALQSVGDLELFDGANIAAIQNTQGGWEVLQFQDAELVDENTYKISRFLRGQAGTEIEMSGSISAGARFVLINGAIVQPGLTLNDVRRTKTWRYGPASKDPASSAYGEKRYAFKGLGLRPFSVTHVKAIQNSDGIELTWIRRARIGADNWEQADVPLAEESERYEVDILDAAGDVVRTLAANKPNASYLNSEIAADFGAAPSHLSIVVHQISATYGRGSAKTALVEFK
ncbi:MAG: phage tail baseplate protein [Hyphomicrobiales bacterium]